MVSAAVPGLLVHALTLTGIAVLPGVLVGLALARMPGNWAVALGAALLLAAGLPLHGGLAIEAVPVLAFIALPLGWGARQVPAQALRIAASLVSPVAVLWRVWLPPVLPWLTAGLALGFARALLGAWLAS